MKAAELRLGNLIKIGGNTLETYQTYTPTKVTLAILNEIAGENEERPNAELSVFQPIELTEEWLIKLGFYSLDKGTCFYKQKTLIVEYLFSQWTGRLYIDQWNSCQIIEIKYVHQLQNLYYALTGEELQPSRLEKPCA